MKRAFTLIEIMVVLAIIALLAALSFPVFRAARESAHKTDSMSRMHQLWLSIDLYRTDNGGGLDHGSAPAMALPPKAKIDPYTDSIRPPVIRWPIGQHYYYYPPDPLGVGPEVENMWEQTSAACLSNTPLFADLNYNDFDPTDPDRNFFDHSALGVALDGHALRQTSPGFPFIASWWHCPK